MAWRRRCCGPAALLVVLLALLAGCTRDAERSSAPDTSNLGEPVASTVHRMEAVTCPSAATRSQDCTPIADPEHFAVRITGVAAGQRSSDEVPVSRVVELDADSSVTFDESVQEGALVHLVCSRSEPTGSCDPAASTGQVTPMADGATLRWIPIDG
jgi:hypothetical protein